MKPWALVPLLLASGCLYLDDIDRPPTVSLDDAITTTVKGAILTVNPTFADPDDPRDQLRFTLDVESVDGQLLDPKCDYVVESQLRPFQIAFFRTGIFRVTVTVFDPHNAFAEASEMLTITDAPPVFSSGAAIQQTSTPDACNLNTAGDVITLQLNGTIADADATAANAGCTPIDKLTYTWRIKDAPSGTKPALTMYDDNNGCLPMTAGSGPTLAVPNSATQVCLWTDPMITGSLAMYNVVLDVSDDPNDPNRTVRSAVGNVVVGVDQPPCIEGTDPVAGGTYVVDRNELQEFKIDGVVDDRDVFGTNKITFVWSVWRETDQTWREVPQWTGSTYQLDVSSFGVGEKVSVRSEVLDGTGTRVPTETCSDTTKDCVVPSCASQPNVCHKWKTWDLELR
jgi:hypothetical protein